MTGDFALPSHSQASREVPSFSSDVVVAAAPVCSVTLATVSRVYA
jgi:hypothetical protein